MKASQGLDEAKLGMECTVLQANFSMQEQGVAVLGMGCSLPGLQFLWGGGGGASLHQNNKQQTLKLWFKKLQIETRKFFPAPRSNPKSFSCFRTKTKKFLRSTMKTVEFFLLYDETKKVKSFSCSVIQFKKFSLLHDENCNGSPDLG